MKKPVPQSVTFEMPLGRIEDSQLFDKEADAVIQFAEQEKQMEQESTAMASNDPLLLKLQRAKGSQSKDAAGREAPPSLPLEVQAEPAQASSTAVGNVEVDDPGLAVPVTPPREFVMVESPRASGSTRRSEDDSEEAMKKQCVEEAKKQRIHQMRMDYEKRLSAVKVEYTEYFTMDELDLEKDWEEGAEIWAGEEQIELQGFLKKCGQIFQSTRHHFLLRAG